MGLYLEAVCKLGSGADTWETIQAQGQASQKSLKLFVSVPSLLQAHPLIDTVSWFLLGA